MNADVTGQGAATHFLLNVGLQIGCHQVFRNAERLCGNIRREVAVKNQRAICDQVTCVVADDWAKTQIAQVGWTQQGIGRDCQLKRAAAQTNKEFVRRQAFATVGVVHAELDCREEAFDFLFNTDTILLQFVFHDTVVVITGLGNNAAAPAQWVGQTDECRVAVIKRRIKGRARRSRNKADGICRTQRLAKSGARIALNAQFVTVCFGITQVDKRFPAVTTFIFDIVSERIEVCFPLEDVVTDNALNIVESAGGHEAVVDGSCRRIEGCSESAEAQRQFDAAFRLVVFKIGIEAIQSHTHRVRCLILQGAVKAEALQLGRCYIGFGTTDDGRRCGGACTGVTPGVEFLQLIGLIHIRGRQRDADGVVCELINEGCVGTIAIFFRTGVQRAEVGVGSTGTNSKNRLAIIQRTHGADVDGANKALTDKRSGWRFEDDNLADDFRRILVEFDRTVVTGRSLFATIQQRLRKVGAKAADRDVVRAAVQTLRCNAGKAGNRFTNRRIRQLADIFCRNRLNDLVVILLFVDGVFKRSAEAGYDDRIFLIFRRCGILCEGRCSKGCNKRSAERKAACTMRKLARRIKLELGHDSLP